MPYPIRPTRQPYGWPGQPNYYAQRNPGWPQAGPAPSYPRQPWPTLPAGGMSPAAAAPFRPGFATLRPPEASDPRLMGYPFGQQQVPPNLARPVRAGIPAVPRPDPRRGRPAPTPAAWPADDWDWDL